MSPNTSNTSTNTIQERVFELQPPVWPHVYDGVGGGVVKSPQAAASKKKRPTKTTQTSTLNVA